MRGVRGATGGIWRCGQRVRSSEYASPKKVPTDGKNRAVHDLETSMHCIKKIERGRNSSLPAVFANSSQVREGRGHGKRHIRAHARQYSRGDVRRHGNGPALAYHIGPSGCRPPLSKRLGVGFVPKIEPHQLARAIAFSEIAVARYGPGADFEYLLAPSEHLLNVRRATAWRYWNVHRVREVAPDHASIEARPVAEGKRGSGPARAKERPRPREARAGQSEGLR